MYQSEFRSRVSEAFRQGSRLCVGIDPHKHLLDEWNFPDTAAGAEAFGRTVLEAVADSAGVLAVKPQVAFFERFGASGYTALENIFFEAKTAGVLCIADAKRGDVGSSFDAYAEAWLLPGGPLEADALTVNPLQGVGVLERAFELAHLHDKGVFVLAVTSNPEAEPILTAATAEGDSVSNFLLKQIQGVNAGYQSKGASDSDVANIGAVLGATVRLEDYGVDLVQDEAQRVMPILAPGFGHQGGSVRGARETFGDFFRGTIIAESRSVLAGSRTGLAGRIESRIARLLDELGDSNNE